MSAKKTTSTKPATKSTSKETSLKETPVKKTPVGRVSRAKMPARRGDLIVIDSAQVGSPPREGEILEVIQGEVRVTYQVRWADGHQTLISPMAGAARIVRASDRG